MNYGNGDVLNPLARRLRRTRLAGPMPVDPRGAPNQLDPAASDVAARQQQLAGQVAARPAGQGLVAAPPRPVVSVGPRPGLLRRKRPMMRYSAPPGAGAGY